MLETRDQLAYCMHGTTGYLTDNISTNGCGDKRVDEDEYSDGLEIYIPALNKGATPGREFEEMNEKGMRTKWRTGKRAIYLYQRS